MLVTECPVCGAELILQTRTWYEDPKVKGEKIEGEHGNPSKWWITEEDGEEYDSAETLRCDQGHTSDEILDALIMVKGVTI